MGFLFLRNSVVERLVRPSEPDRIAFEKYHALQVDFTHADFRGHPHEVRQLGDGYRTRADTLMRSARDVKGLSQERDYLTRAAESYRQALDQYAKATDYLGVPRNIALAQRSLTMITR